ncbi:MAG: (2Fe-2S) ferredoxin domain-containing protein [Mariprofundaceae bacterium]|nr:(2Fe-2S) ferredoxin domain-containing protein [Mariprofundaceae bacterium]
MAEEREVVRSDNRVRIRVCHGPRCHDYGGQALSSRLEALGIESEAGECQSLCPYSPVVHLNERFIPRASVDEIVERLKTLTAAH